ncbi:MAG: Na(+)-translocating NADH-quinone reductase subunit A [Bacteroidota bacterium]
MSETIKLKRGLDIKLQGEADKVFIPLRTRKFALKPTDFVGLRYAKLLVNEGDEVKVGTQLCYDKYRENIPFTSPVSGKVVGIKRGPKRILEEIQIESDDKGESIDFGSADPNSLSAEEVTKKLLDSGVWAGIRQRPYSVVADPEEKPKAIFISGFNSAPLAPDQDMIVHGKGKEFQTGLDALAKLTEGKIHLSLSAQSKASEVFTNAKKVELHYFNGPHPAGNVGIQIHHIDPLNKGEVVWYLNPQQVLTIGRLFLEGKYNPERIVALTGSEIKKTGYFKTIIGASIEEMVKNNTTNETLRYISGNVLTGRKIRKDGYIGYYDDQVTVIPEGNYYEFFGWAKPGLNKFSVSRTFLSTWFKPSQKHRLDTNMHGGERAYVMTGEYESVIPMDIYPVQLVKAIMIEDIDLMENLGIYEVDEEDFALAEVICTSKIDVQDLIRKGLDLMRSEMS